MPALPTDTSSDEPRDLLGAALALTKPYPGMGESLGRRKWRRVKDIGGRSSTCFHLMSRLCEGVPFFDDTDKEALVIILRRMARFCGIKLLTYCVMGNHFHALVRVPHREEWLRRFAGPEGESRLLSHLRILYSRAYVELLSAQWMRWQKDGRSDLVEAGKQAILKRFCDISTFAKEVKARFARWFNQRHRRRGVLWMARFKSVLVEGRPESGSNALQVMAAYIDLNPVRAALTAEAKHYRWSGWSAALREDKEAIEGLCDVVGCQAGQWKTTGAATYGRWVENLDRDSIHPHELLQRVRAFTGGLALGSTDFVEEVFEKWRGLFGTKRETGARPILRHTSRTEWARGLRALRDLRTPSGRQPGDHRAASAAEATSAVS